MEQGIKTKMYSTEVADEAYKSIVLAPCFVLCRKKISIKSNYMLAHVIFLL